MVRRSKRAPGPQDYSATVLADRSSAIIEAGSIGRSREAGQPSAPTDKRTVASGIAQESAPGSAGRPAGLRARERSRRGASDGSCNLVPL